MSAELAALSMQRAGAPRFPGTTYADQLRAGRAAALAALRVHVPSLRFDPAAADQTLREIEVWEARNHKDLVAVMGNPSVTALPKEIQTALGAERAGQFIVATFTRAAIGIGPWQSGAVGVAAASGHDVVTTEWARIDAETRLQVFGSIVKMQSDGELAQFFEPPGGTNGFGAVWVVPVIIAAVVVAAMILVYLYASKRLELNNKVMADLCKEAQAKGDKATVASCIDASRDLQRESVIPWGGLITAATVLGGVYLALRYLPEALAKRRALP